MRKHIGKFGLGLVCLMLLFGITLRGLWGQTTTTYYYVVTAVSSAGFESVYSNEANAVPTAALPVVHLTWSASTSSNISGYNAYRGTMTGGPYTKINTALISGLTYSDSFKPNPPGALGAAPQAN